MRRCEAASRLHERLDDVVHRARLAQPAAEVRTVDVFERDEDVLLDLADLEDRDDVRMSEASHRLCLT